MAIDSGTAVLVWQCEDEGLRGCSHQLVVWRGHYCGFIGIVEIITCGDRLRLDSRHSTKERLRRLGESPRRLLLHIRAHRLGAMGDALCSMQRSMTSAGDLLKHVHCR